MASVRIPQSRPRVSSIATILLSMAGDVDSYWSRKAFGDTFGETQLQLSDDERGALSLIHRGLFRLFPFDPDQDTPENLTPRHLV
jgi:hypothetical protein